MHLKKKGRRNIFGKEDYTFVLGRSKQEIGNKPENDFQDRMR